MTSRPSMTQTGFCSPSSTRNFGAVPAGRNSPSWSLTYCNGFCLLACVTVSLILSPPRRFCTSGWGNSLLAASLLRSLHSVRIHQNLTRQAALQQRERIFKLLHRRALPKQRLQIQPTRLQTLSHLRPSPIHPPPVNPLCRSALENHVVH